MVNFTLLSSIHNKYMLRAKHINHQLKMYTFKVISVFLKGFETVCYASSTSQASSPKFK
jgi:hypothetical protein